MAPARRASQSRQRMALCVGARRRPGPWTGVAAKTLAVILIGEQVSWQIQFLIHDDWNRFDSLPFDLCDFTCFVAAVACWTQLPLLVELTWFWALAGTLQAIITPDQYTPFPHLSFDNYVVEHLGIVVAALYLVIGPRIYPRPGAVKQSSLSASGTPACAPFSTLRQAATTCICAIPRRRPASSPCSAPGPGTSFHPPRSPWSSSCSSTCPSVSIIRVTLGQSTPDRAQSTTRHSDPFSLGCRAADSRLTCVSERKRGDCRVRSCCCRRAIAHEVDTVLGHGDIPYVIDAQLLLLRQGCLSPDGVSVVDASPVGGRPANRASAVFLITVHAERCQDGVVAGRQLRRFHDDSRVRESNVSAGERLLISVGDARGSRGPVAPWGPWGPVAPLDPWPPMGPTEALRASWSRGPGEASGPGQAPDTAGAHRARSPPAAGGPAGPVAPLGPGFAVASGWSVDRVPLPGPAPMWLGCCPLERWL